MIDRGTRRLNTAKSGPVGPCPGPGYEWIDGDYYFDGGIRLWRAGYWRAPFVGVYGGPRYYGPVYERGFYGRGYERGFYGRGFERGRENERFEHNRFDRERVEHGRSFRR